MDFPDTLSQDELRVYQRAVMRSLAVRSHFDVMAWLQGDMQPYLQHDIMVAAWGNFAAASIRHDILSAMAGVRSHNTPVEPITPLLQRLFERWTRLGRKPHVLGAADYGQLREDPGLRRALGHAIDRMRSAMVHGIGDGRGSHQCLYLAFSGKAPFREAEQQAMAIVLPYIDAALRQVQHLPSQTRPPIDDPQAAISRLGSALGLSEREAEVLHWVALGKTNPVIGCILGISEFTVKNHMQRLFRKLDVSNRAQAVGRLRERTEYV